MRPEQEEAASFNLTNDASAIMIDYLLFTGDIQAVNSLAVHSCHLFQIPQSSPAIASKFNRQKELQCRFCIQMIRSCLSLPPPPTASDGSSNTTITANNKEKLSTSGSLIEHVILPVQHLIDQIPSIAFATHKDSNNRGGDVGGGGSSEPIVISSSESVVVVNAVDTVDVQLRSRKWSMNLSSILDQIQSLPSNMSNDNNDDDDDNVDNDSLSVKKDTLAVQLMSIIDEMESLLPKPLLSLIYSDLQSGLYTPGQFTNVPADVSPVVNGDRSTHTTATSDATGAPITTSAMTKNSRTTDTTTTATATRGSGSSSSTSDDVLTTTTTTTANKTANRPVNNIPSSPERPHRPQSRRYRAVDQAQKLQQAQQKRVPTFKPLFEDENEIDDIEDDDEDDDNVRRDKRSKRPRTNHHRSDLVSRRIIAPSSSTTSGSSNHAQRTGVASGSRDPVVVNSAAPNTISLKRRRQDDNDNGNNNNTTSSSPPASRPIHLGKSPANSLSALAASGRKRSRVFWTKQEEENLIEGIKQFGVGRWSEILNRYEFNPCRDAIALRDKWRNLTK